MVRNKEMLRIIGIICLSLLISLEIMGNERIKEEKNEKEVQLEEHKILINNLMNKDIIIQENAKKKLVALQNKAIPILKECLKDDEWYKRFQVVDVLCEINTFLSSNLLLKVAMEDKDVKVRLLAINALGKRKIDIKPEVVIKLINDKDEHIRDRSLNIIKESTTNIEVVNCLIKNLIAEKEWRTKCKIARVLSKLYKVDVKLRMDPIMKLLENECETPSSLEFDEGSYAPITEIIKRQYMFALVDIGTSSVSFLRRIIKKKENTEFTQRIIIILGWLKQKDSFSALCDMVLNAKDGWVRAMAARTLGEFKDKKAVPILKKALNDHFWVKPTKIDVIPPYEYMKIIYPVRKEAFSSLLQLGVKVKHKGTGPKEYHEYEIINDK